jgi:hypothetical protein
MSRRLLTASIVAAVAFGPAAHAAVVVTALPNPLLLRDEFFGSYYPLDIDSNGTTDVTFAYSFSFVGLRTEAYNRAVIRLIGPVGGRISALPSSFSINSTIGTELLSELQWSSSDFIDGFVEPDESAYISIVQVLSTGSASEFSGRSAIGIEFRAADGIHYGYLDIDAGPGYAGITLYGWAYESQPGVPIFAGQVPEPSTSLFVGVATASILLRRRRK